MKGLLFTVLVLVVVALIALVSAGTSRYGLDLSTAQTESSAGDPRPLGHSATADSSTHADADSLQDAIADSSKIETQPAGMRVFLSYKCDMCHTVWAAGIGSAPSPGPTTEDEMDLSKVGETRTRSWLSLYLLKKEAIEGAKHYKAFTGTEQEEDELVAWLVGLSSSQGKTEPDMAGGPADTLGAGGGTTSSHPDSGSSSDADGKTPIHAKD
jgi:hypothetical protein